MRKYFSLFVSLLFAASIGLAACAKKEAPPPPPPPPAEAPADNAAMAPAEMEKGMEAAKPMEETKPMEEAKPKE